MLTKDRGLPTIEAAPLMPHDRKLLMLAFLAPDIQRNILAGKQPPTLNLEMLGKMRIPLSWQSQREMLGWAKSGHPCSAQQLP